MMLRHRPKHKYSMVFLGHKLFTNCTRHFEKVTTSSCEKLFALLCCWNCEYNCVCCTFFGLNTETAMLHTLCWRGAHSWNTKGFIDFTTNLWDSEYYGQSFGNSPSPVPKTNEKCWPRIHIGCIEKRIYLEISKLVGSCLSSMWVVGFFGRYGPFHFLIQINMALALVQNIKNRIVLKPLFFCVWNVPIQTHFQLSPICVDIS